MPPSISERDPNYTEDVIDIEGLDFPIPGSIDMDESGRMKEIEELKPLEDEAAKNIPSVFIQLGIVADEMRAKALGQLLRGKTPSSVIQKRQGKGGQTFSYIPGWYVKKTLNSLFAMMWNFELIPVTEGQLFNMTSRQVIVMGKLTIMNTKGQPKIIKMGMGKKDIAYQKIDGKSSTTPVDLGNDIKAAETDALKRCAVNIGIGLDLYQND
jgi:hypothetical protein